MASVKDMQERIKHLESQLAQSRKHAAELQRWKDEAIPTLERLGKELLLYTQAKLDKAEEEKKRLEGRSIIKPGDPDFNVSVVKRIGGRR